MPPSAIAISSAGCSATAVSVSAIGRMITVLETRTSQVRRTRILTQTTIETHWSELRSAESTTNSVLDAAYRVPSRIEDGGNSATGGAPIRRGTISRVA